MNKVKRIRGREILDSRGRPTVEVDVFLESGHMGRMMVPSGASTGLYEALELRDGDMKRYNGKGVLKAVNYVNTELARALIGMDAQNQEHIDQTMIDLDGTENKTRFGANAILGISMAAAHAVASYLEKPLYRHFAELYLPAGAEISIPIPMVNMISGGLHAGKNIDMQDFLIIPVGAKSYPQALEMLSEVYFKLKDILHNKGYVSSLIADEGGFGPSLSSNRKALDLICQAVEEANFRLQEDIAFAIDVASSHFYNPESKQYRLASEGKDLTTSQMIDKLEEWCSLYPIISIEDGLAEDDWEGWQELTRRLGGKIQIVGDDFFTTNPKRIQRGIDGGAANSVLIKMNQIGTLSETVKAVKMAKEAGYRTIVSARSGETEDTTMADLAVGLNSGQIKIGSVARSSRLAKYNQLLRIDEQLEGKFAGRSIFFE